MRLRLIFSNFATETVLDTKHLLNILKFYRRSGFGVALDDMCSGYAGLTTLADLQPEFVPTV